MPSFSIRTILLGLAALLAACGTARAESPSLVIQTDWVPHGGHAGIHLASEKNWFREQGLEVTVLDGKGSVSTIQQLAAGQCDVAFVQLSSMAAAISNGLPIISIMGLVRAGDTAIVFPTASGWKTMADLKGKRIGLPAGSGSASLFDPFLKAAGVSRSDYEVVSVDSAAEYGIYLSGAIDAAVSPAGSMLPAMVAGRPSSAIYFSDVGLRVPGYGLVVRKSDLDSRAEAFAKIVAIQRRAWDYILAGHEDEGGAAVAAQRPALRIDAAGMRDQILAYRPSFYTPATKDKPIGWQAESDWIDALAAMASVGMVKPGLKPADVYTNRFFAEK